ncbi:unnamed protein product [Rotaria sp. Silwood2]|nr:unnamed protein product [Rotaria sp. Silwood2]
MLAIIIVCKSEEANPEIISWNTFGSKSLSHAEWQKQVLEFWTPARMRKAKPMEVLRKNITFTQSSEKSFFHVLPNTNGPLTLIEPRAPDNITFRNRLIGLIPKSRITVGKLFFIVPGGYATCSASVVTSATMSLVVTAAHCLLDHTTRTWFYNWIFVPAYSNGVAPLGIWVAIGATLLKAYYNTVGISPNHNYDVGFLIILPQSWIKIAQVTGSQGLKFNAPRKKLTYSAGYPQNIANGEILSSCTSVATVAPCRVPGYIGQAIQCGMGHGCSGGPWIVDFIGATGLGFVNSVNSFSCVRVPNKVHGPFFEKNILALYNFANTKL